MSVSASPLRLLNWFGRHGANSMIVMLMIMGVGMIPQKFWLSNLLRRDENDPQSNAKVKPA